MIKLFPTSKLRPEHEAMLLDFYINGYLSPRKHTYNSLEEKPETSKNISPRKEPNILEKALRSRVIA